MSNSVLPSSPVFFGIATEVEPDELYKLERQYLPLGKVGGFPAWLNPVTIPQSEDLECSVSFYWSLKFKPSHPMDLGGWVII